MGTEPAPPAPPQMSGESDADLLGYMALAGDEPPAARAAWAEFYRRHATYLFRVCLRAYGRLFGGQAGAADLVAESFRRAYEHAGTFDDGGIADRRRQRLRVRAWLGRIAHRLACSALRGRSRVATHSLPPRQWQQISPRRRPRPDAQRVAAVREAMLTLSDREQTVLRVTFQWYDPGRAHQRLPNDVAADLAETLGTTPENLRQIRRRTLRKIKTILENARLSENANDAPSQQA